MTTQELPPTEEPLPLWVIYKNPRDYPNRHVVRRHLVGPGCVEPDRIPTAVVETLNEARSAVPLEKFNLHRMPDDDPCIVEVWV